MTQKASYYSMTELCYSGNTKMVQNKTLTVHPVNPTKLCIKTAPCCTRVRCVYQAAIFSGPAF